MDKTAVNAQLVTTGLKCALLSSQICWLRKIRSVEKFCLVANEKEWVPWFCCLLDLSSDFMSRASF